MNFIEMVPDKTEEIHAPAPTDWTDGLKFPQPEEDWPGESPEDIQNDDDTGMSNDTILKNSQNKSYQDKKQSRAHTESTVNNYVKVFDLEAALVRQRDIVKNIWPNVSNNPGHEFHQFLDIYTSIKKTNAPNFVHAKIPVPSDLVIVE